VGCGERVGFAVGASGAFCLRELEPMIQRATTKMRNKKTPRVFKQRTLQDVSQVNTSGISLELG